MLSRSVTLAPGDLVYTCTPAGVGPLQASEVVGGGVAGIGEFTMTAGDAFSQRRALRSSIRHQTSHRKDSPP